MDWSQLRAEFEQLQEPLRFTRLDYQWGAAGVYYRLAGGTNTNAIRRFELLSGIAGARLAELPSDVVCEEVLAAPDPASKWYEALRQYAGSFEFGFPGMQTNEAGENLGSIYSGSLNTPAESSSLVCLRFLAISAQHTHAQAVVPPTPVPRFGRINAWLKREAEHRGYLWAIGGFVLTVVLAALAL